MSQPYQVLARKYRPKNFHELVGQTHVSKALINAIDHNRLHHAYLFTGTRGVGKTTIARILSKCLNCETGITSTPCGICNTCVAIDEGRFIDLIEIDAASRTKVEDTRELIDNVPYAPTQGRYKVYLIDEVHMLSTHSFNALLKTLEEPPAHVKFLLATTDPQKLPITIISRCLQFVLRPLPQQAISDHLANILTSEGVGYTQPALWQLANAAKGSVRDALSLTDQAIAFGQGELTNDTVNDMLGLIDSADLIRLLSDIYQGNTGAVAAHIEQMRAQLVDAGSMFDGLAELLHQLAMTQLLPDVALNVNEEQTRQIKALAQHISADVLQLYYQITIQGREQITLANTPLQALEMCLLRLLAFRPLASNEVPVNEVRVNEERVNELPSVKESINDKSDPVNKQLVNEPFVEGQLVDDEPNSPIDPNELKELDGDNPITPIDDTHPLVASSESEQTTQNTSLLQPFEEDVAPIHDSFKDKTHSSLSSESHTKPSSPISIPDSKRTPDSEHPQDNDISQLKNTQNSSEKPYQVEGFTPPKLTPPSNQESDEEADKVSSEEFVAKTTQLASPDLQLAKSDPRLVLQCEAVELAGEWTPEKWDFWLQTARQSGKLAQDELALARQGIMTGNITGNSEFKVAFDTKNMKNIFNHLAKHLTEQFGAKVTVTIDASLADENGELLPQTRQNKRLDSAKTLAKKLLMQSPVMHQLVKDYDGEISSLKLLPVD